ncbi:hypothetical protein CXF68_05085 [Tenacibaculum sp. Bg11-29]|uniref:tetratricopeptide repeat protein n=1 Tax=Tenacibaculum sp. Bg11-29 TaxID=2058306 RepID=UPI000C3411D9|nr:tetratricopeptide repeat protein [Tenacibaculum sp. Bg11-29]PKH50114.1 hypothetical protein CXF68_05085 [Tenacibaculum sp. Bg11-29]
MLKNTIFILIISLIFSCKKKKPILITVNDDPLIQYYRVNKENIVLISSDFNEKDLTKKNINLIIDKNYKDLKVALLKDLSINPKNSITLHNLGNLELILKKFPKAITYYNKSILLSDSTYYPSILSLGKAYGILGEDKKAEKLYNHIIEKSEIDFLIAISYLGLSKMYLDYGWIDKAKTSISKSESLLVNYNDYDLQIDVLKKKINDY